jgi:hypothetical protein
MISVVGRQTKKLVLRHIKPLRACRICKPAKTWGLMLQYTYRGDEAGVYRLKLRIGTVVFELSDSQDER